MAGEEDFDLSAAWLRADGAELAISIEAIAHKLEEAMPTRTRVERHSRRLFGGGKQVRRVRVELGDDIYSLSVEGDQVQGARERKVGGISIKRETLGLGDWVKALGTELREEAQRSGEARAALEGLLD
jgi:hypothetical protein